MVHKTVVTVDVSCDKCKQEVFNAVTKLEGVNKMEADSDKCTLTVIGDADPYAIISCLRKAGKNAHFISVGPPPKPEEKKPDPKCACKGCCCACKPELPKCVTLCKGCCCGCKPVVPKCQTPCKGCCPSKSEPPKCPPPCPPPKCQPLPPCPPPKCQPLPPCPPSSWANKPEPPKCPCPYQGPGGCWVCQPIVVMSMNYQDPPPPCSIM